MIRDLGFQGILSVLVSWAAYWTLGYLIPREDTNELLATYLVLFLPYIYWSFIKPQSAKTILYIGLLFRLALLFAQPALTDDFYRFFWDGTLTINGVNPFNFIPAEIPSELYQSTWLNHETFQLLNSPEYYTVYPPLLQGIFAASAWVSQGDISIFLACTKGLNIVFEIFTWFAMLKLLHFLKLPENRLALYFLNPLIILELNANLHYEVAMICMLSLACLYLIRKNAVLVGIFLTLAVACKLYPILLFPLFLFQLKGKQKLVFTLSFAISMLVVFWPFFGLEQLSNMKKSIDLYFETFEFNASIYYIVRWVGYQNLGYNIGFIAGSVLGLIALLLIGLLALYNLKKDNLKTTITSISISIAIYYLLSSTVMPWYISGVLAFSIFGQFRFPIVWSALIIFSYVAYATESVKENMTLIAIEYILVYLTLIAELWGQWKSFKLSKTTEVNEAIF